MKPSKRLDIRTTLQQRIAELGWSKHRLAKEVASHVPRSVVYGYLAEEFDTTTANAAAMLEATGMTIRPKKEAT